MLNGEKVTQFRSTHRRPIVEHHVGCLGTMHRWWIGKENTWVEEGLEKSKRAEKPTPGPLGPLRRSHGASEWKVVSLGSCRHIWRWGMLEFYSVFARSILIRTSANLNTIIVGLLSPFGQCSGKIFHLKLSTDRFLWGTYNHRIALLVGRSRNRFPVVTLGTGGDTGEFFRSYRQNHVPWGRLSL
jgi:hypothetical protein